MNNRAMLPIFLLPLLLIGGCWDRTELNDLAIVTAIAIDKAEKNQVRVSVQVIAPQKQSGGTTGGGGGGGSGSGEPQKTVLRFEEGSDISEALSMLQRKLPRKLFWGQCKIIIFSEAVARAGVRHHFDFLVRHPQIRERAYMVVSKGKAADTLALYPPIERTSAEALRKLSDLKIGIRVTMEQFSQRLKGESQALALPIIYILPTDPTLEPKQTIPYIYGSAVFKKDKMAGTLSEMVTRGVLWVRNEIQAYTVTYQLAGSKGVVSLRPVEAHVKLIPHIRGDDWSITVKVRTEGDIVQNGTLLDPMNPKRIAEMNEAFAEDVEERIRLAIREAQQRLKADIFDFAKAFHRKYPKRWEQASKRWDEIYPEVQVNVKVNAHIIRPGLIDAPGGMPKEEAITE